MLYNLKIIVITLFISFGLYYIQILRCCQYLKQKINVYLAYLYQDKNKMPS